MQSESYTTTSVPRAKPQLRARFNHMKIGIIDYGAGNLHSVRNALRELGVEHRIFDSPEGLDSCEKLILPGVGAFGDSMSCLSARKLTEPVRDWLAAGRPFLGICIGYQLLFESSEEAPGVSGLGFLAGKVTRFPSGKGLKIPHMGWNLVRVSDPDSKLWQGWPQDPYLYFVHSFHPEPEDQAIISSTTDYGYEFASSIQVGEIHGVQFHPERSQELGLRLLANFVT